MKFSELQQLLKKNFGIDHLADIARELGVSPQAVSNWKSRDRIPYKYVIKIRKKIKESDTQNSGLRENNVSDSNQVFPKYINHQYSKEDNITLIDLLLIMVKHLRIIIIMPIIFCILMIFHVQFRLQPIYESSAKIMSGSSNESSEASGIAAAFGIGLPVNNTGAQLVYTEIVKSRTFARKMLKRKFDTEVFGPQRSLLQILTYGNQETTVDLDRLIQTGVNDVIGMIDIQQEGSIYILTIDGPEPLFVRDFALTVIEELDKHQREYNDAKTTETRQFIEERIIDTQKELEAAEESLKDFYDSNRRIEESPTLRLKQQRLSREVAVLTGVFTTLKQQLETTKIEQVKDSDYVVVLDPPEVPLGRSKPNKRQMVILAGFLGIGIGTIIGFLREFVKNSKEEEKEKMDKAKSLFIKNISLFIPRRYRKT